MNLPTLKPNSYPPQFEQKYFVFKTQWCLLQGCSRYLYNLKTVIPSPHLPRTQHHLFEKCKGGCGLSPMEKNAENAGKNAEKLRENAVKILGLRKWLGNGQKKKKTCPNQEKYSRKYKPLVMSHFHENWTK